MHRDCLESRCRHECWLLENCDNLGLISNILCPKYIHFYPHGGCKWMWIITFRCNGWSDARKVSRTSILTTLACISMCKHIQAHNSIINKTIQASSDLEWNEKKNTHWFMYFAIVYLFLSNHWHWSMIHPRVIRTAELPCIPACVSHVGGSKIQPAFVTASSTTTPSPLLIAQQLAFGLNIQFTFTNSLNASNLLQ
jgi:hypothetical protein